MIVVYTIIHQLPGSLSRSPEAGQAAPRPAPPPTGPTQGLRGLRRARLGTLVRFSPSSGECIFLHILHVDFMPTYFAYFCIFFTYFCIFFLKIYIRGVNSYFCIFCIFLHISVYF